MQSISNTEISDMLLFVEERMNLTLQRCRGILSANDFLASAEKMDIFDATCMRLQTIGETIYDSFSNRQRVIFFVNERTD